MQFPFAVHFFVVWPLMVLWDEIWLCRKTIFQAPIFFSHMLGLLPIHEAGPCNNSDKLRARCDCEKADCRKPRKRYSDGPLDAERVHCRDSSLQPSSLQSDTLTIMLQEPCLQGILPSDSLSLPWLPRAGFMAAKNQFFTLWKIVFSALLRQAWLCKNTIFQALVFFFFACLLSNLSSLQIVQMRAIHN